MIIYMIWVICIDYYDLMLVLIIKTLNQHKILICTRQKKELNSHFIYHFKLALWKFESIIIWMAAVATLCPFCDSGSHLAGTDFCPDYMPNPDAKPWLGDTELKKKRFDAWEINRVQ